MKTKKIICLLLVLCMAFSLVGCGESNQPAPESNESAGTDTGSSKDDYVVQMPMQSAICSAPIFIAMENGFLDEMGVKFEYINSETNIWDLIASGKADVSYGLLPTFIQRIANGFDLSVVAGIHFGCINVVAAKDSDIYSIADLKGKTVGIPGSMGSDPAVLLQRLLVANNIPINEVDLQVYTNADLETALLEGHVEAFVSWDPYATAVARKMDERIIYNMAIDDMTKDEFCCVLGLRKEFVEEHPEVAKRFTQAVVKASEWIAENPYEAAKIIYEKGYVPDPDVDLNGELLDSYNYTGKYESAKDSFVKVTKDLMDLEIISINVSAEEFADNVFVNIGELE